jgi:hypothetical protein
MMAGLAGQGSGREGHVAIYRVTAEPNPHFGWWPHAATECFYCTQPLVVGDLAVTWVSINGYGYWHVQCAKD